MNQRLISLLLLLFVALPLTCFAADDELLDPEQAFALSTSMKDGHTAVAEWEIADGYYLYRNNFNFISETEGVQAGTPVLPDGKIKDDEFFGKIEIYKHHVKAEVPLKGDLKPGQEVTLNITAQGCNEPMGVCYPPQHYKVALKVPETAASGNPLSALKNLAASIDTGSSDQELLDPDQAFAFSLDVPDASNLLARWSIADNYYLYKDKIRLSLKDSNGNALGPIKMPEAINKHDQIMGDTLVYKHGLAINVPLTHDEGAPTDLTLVADFQGCNEALGVCYPPVHKEIPFSIANLPAGTTAEDATPATQTAPAGEPVSEQDSIAASLASGNIILTLLTFFGLGLLLAFTPCVFPMIPILSGIIIGQGEKISTGRAFSLSLAYVLAMAATYTVAGVLAGLFGANIQVWFQNPWVLGVFAGIFVLLSLSMFGFYELQMPNAIQSRLTEVSNKQKSGSLIGAGIMGLLSALIVGPCVTAPLVGALIYIGQTGDAVLGGAALFFLSLGMGAPLLVIGTSAGKLLPRAGAWMDATKAVFGVLLLGVAIWLIERVIPEAITLLLSAALLIVSAIYMGALEPIREAASGWMRLWKGIGIILLIWGTILLVGAASGGHDLLQPLKGIHGTSTTLANGQAQNELHFRKVKTLADLEQAIDEARTKGQPVMFDFYADWCVSCKEMEKYTFTDPGVHQALEGVMLLQADVTANDAQDKELLANFGIIGPPAILFFNEAGIEKRNYRVVGYKPADEFAAHINKMRSPN